MPDLAQFLIARITEDELVARTSIDSGGREWWTEAEVIEKFTGDTGDTADTADAAHIARFSPERVLAECDAKRRVLDEHFPNRAHGDVALLCITCRYNPDAMAPAAWPCSTVRALALPYADHANYREHWRP